jgi:regulator of protease activity HflC (stomatin/prohibitin superfamily)
VTDVRAAVSTVGDVRQTLYREALRAVIGARELDAFLAGKDAVAGEAEEQVRRRLGALGLEIVSVGVREII